MKNELPWLRKEESFFRRCWWSFVKTLWLLSLNGVLVLYALDNGGVYGKVFSLLIAVTGVVVIVKEIVG